MKGKIRLSRQLGNDISLLQNNEAHKILEDQKET